MSAPVFILINDDRLMVKLDSIIAIEELGAHDIDIRTGRLALGVPEGATAKIHTERATFYIKTTYDELTTLIQSVMAHG